MILQQLRRLTAAAVVVCVAVGAASAAAEEAEPAIVFLSSGFGHGIGMSQYGALGRAEAGHAYAEILAFYYAGTTIESVDDYGTFAEGDDVDVLIDIRTTVTVSVPYENGSAQEGWEVELLADGVALPTTAVTPVTATWTTDGTWSARAGDVELCNETCTGELSFRLVSGTHVVLEEHEDGPNVGNPAGGVTGAYRGGRVILHPGALGGGCGNATDFCVIHGDLDLQDYLYGIAEIPTSWPIEAQRAQAVAARSYAASAIVRRTGNGKAYDIEDSVQDQYYGGYGRFLSCGNWCDGVDDTDDEVVVSDGQIAETFYSSSNGGHTVSPPDVWSAGTTRPYLAAVPDPFDGNEANPNKPRELAYTFDQVSRWLDGLHVGTVRSIDIADVPPSGRITFATVTVVGTDNTVVTRGYRLYNALMKGCGEDPDCDPPRSTNLSLVSITFRDVEYNDYFYLPVSWMKKAGITTGTSPTEFSPHHTVTRDQAAAFLWRFAGEPGSSAPSGFTDVVEGSFYEEAVSWMREAGITTGTSPTEFSPHHTVTRGQAAAFLWRFAGEPVSSATHDFVDVAENRYYTQAVRWMVEHDITTGTSPTTFAPEKTLERAEVATFLWRLAGKPEAFADGVELPPAMRET